MRQTYKIVFLSVLLLALWLLPSHDANAAGCEVNTGLTTHTNLFIFGLPLCDAQGSQYVALTTLLFGEDSTNSLIRVSGGAVRTTAIMTDVLTDTASATTAIFRGTKTFTANVDGTGAVTATVTIYGDTTSTAEAVHLLCTITLTATTRDVDACPPITAEYPFYHAVTASVTGTGAAVDVNAHY